MRLILSFIISFISLTTFAQQLLPDTIYIPISKELKIGKLSNGLTYYLRKNNWPENRACFYLAQRVGSLQEEENQRGLAHFLEHMSFNGSEHFKGNSVVEYCQKLGVEYGEELNAYTSQEEIVYNIDNVPTNIGQEKLDSCLLILYDWANGLTLDSMEIEKERGVIHEEWRQRVNAVTRIRDRQLPIVFSGSKYGTRQPIGIMEVVDSFRYQELRDYYERWYNPQNQCVVVVGNINVKHTERKIKEIFGSIKPSATAGVVKSEPVSDTKGIIFSIDKDKELQDNYIQLHTSEQSQSVWTVKFSQSAGGILG